MPEEICAQDFSTEEISAQEISTDAGPPAPHPVAPHPALRQGLFAQGQLDLSREDAVVLPRAAVRAGATGPFVQALRGGRIEHLPVTLGPGGRVEGDASPMVAITSGVQPGERVLRDTIGLLRPGTVVDNTSATAQPAELAQPR